MVCNDYQYDFFQSEPLKAITTGKEVPNDVAQHMLSSSAHLQTMQILQN